MADVADLTVKGKADLSQPKKEVDDLNEHVGRSSGFFSTALAALTGFVGGTVIIGTATAAFGFLKDTIKESVDAASLDQGIQAQLTAALKSTGGAAGLTAENLNALAEKMSLTTTFSKDTVLQAEVLGLRFSHLGKEIFPQVIQQAENISARMGIDLNGALRLVGRATDDPIKGLTALSRLGVTFDAQTKEQIKSLIASGDTMKAQQLILDQLNIKFGGAAQAAGGTFAGQLKILSNSFEEVKVKIGNAIIPILTQLLTAVQPIVNQLGGVLPPILGQVSGLLAKVFPPVVGAITAVTPVLAGLVRSFLDFETSLTGGGVKTQALSSTLTNALPSLSSLHLMFDSLVSTVKSVAPTFQQAGSSLGSTLVPAFLLLATVGRDLIPPVFLILRTLIRDLAPLLATIAQAISQQVVPALLAMLPVIQPIIAQLGVWITQLLNALVPLLQTVLPIAITILVDAFRVVLAVVAAVWPAVATLISAAINIIVGTVKLLSDILHGNWGKIWGDVLNILGAAVFGIINTVLALLTGIGSLFGKLWSLVGPTITSFFSNLWNGFIGGLSYVGILIENGITSYVKFWLTLDGRVLGAIASIPGNLGRFFLNMATSLGRIILDGITSYVNFWLGLDAKILNAIVNIPKDLYSAGASWMTNISNGIINNISGVTDAISKLKDKLISALKNLADEAKKAISNVPGIGNGLENIFNHLGFAAGTADAPGGFATVGEGGEPELVVGPHFGYLPKGSGVYPLSKLGAGGGGSVSQPLTQVITLVIDRSTIAREVIKGTPREVWLMTGQRG